MELCCFKFNLKTYERSILLFGLPNDHIGVAWWPALSKRGLGCRLVSHFVESKGQSSEISIVFFVLGAVSNNNFFHVSSINEKLHSFA